MRAFLYARVSTGEQNEGMQTREMLESCQRRGWKPKVFADAGWSGSKEGRPEFQCMMKLARQKKCDVVMVYRYDRFARSVKQLVTALEEFDALGIQFISVHENIDTTLPHGKLMFHIFASIAEFERELIRERVRSGMDDARLMLRQGKPTRRGKTRWAGRPRSIADAAKIASLRAEGEPWSEVARQAGVSVMTARRIHKASQELLKPVQKAVEKMRKRPDDNKGLAKRRKSTK